jgi:hypothetical protein
VIADLIPAVAADSLANVEAIFCANIHDTQAGWITLIHKKGGIEYILTNKLRVAPKTTLNAILGKPLYLPEGDSPRAKANADDNIICLAPFALMA